MHRNVLAHGLRWRLSPLKFVRFVTQSHYDILGLKHDATQDEIKAAYKEMSKKLHPDVNKVDPETHHKFIELTDAYTVLGKTVTRLQYDRELELQRQYAEQMNACRNFDSTESGFRNEFFGGKFSFHDQEILRRRSQAKQFTEAQTKQLTKDAIHVTIVLLTIGIAFSFAVSRKAKSKQNYTAKSARESIEADKRYIREIQLIDEQSIDDLIEEVKTINRSLEAKGS